MLIDPGEVVSPGAEVARIVDTDPLVVEMRVAQRSIGQVAVGMVVEVAFVTGQERSGRVRYVSANAQAATRTFAVEVEVPNPERDVPPGISAEVRLPVEEIAAHFVSPAILSLGTEGDLGIKTVSGDGRVEFYPVELVRAQTAGIWVAGLPEEAAVITVGQGFVVQGEPVRVTLAEGVQEVEPVADAGEVGTSEPAPSAPAEMAGAVVAVTEPTGDDRPTAGETAPAPDRESEQVALATASIEEAADGAADTSVVIGRVQERLNALGYDAGPADGVLGPSTREAIRAFEAARDLPVTGDLSPDLLTALQIAER